MPTALERLLAPTACKDFVADYLGRECLFNKGPGTRFGDLFQWQAVERILSGQRFDFPRLRLVRRGKIIPSMEYMALRRDRRGNPYTCHVSRSVVREMRQGAMLHITAVNDAWEPLARFSAALELDLTARVQVNLHAALARSRGFATHWDGHDVFVIQVAGKKVWRLFGFTDVAPLAVSPDHKRNPPQHVSSEIVLEAGDMLYVPRGYWHAAEALDDISLHLTFAAQFPTGLDFLSWLASRLEGEVAFRQDVPFSQFECSGDADSYRAKYVTELKTTLGDKLHLSTLTEFLQEYRSSLGHTNEVQLDGGSDAERRSCQDAHS
jgi:hypothetical protein